MQQYIDLGDIAKYAAVLMIASTWQSMLEEAQEYMDKAENIRKEAKRYEETHPHQCQLLLNIAESLDKEASNMVEFVRSVSTKMSDQRTIH